jgi:hypothetical protein
LLVQVHQWPPDFGSLPGLLAFDFAGCGFNFADEFGVFADFDFVVFGFASDFAGGGASL